MNSQSLLSLFAERGCELPQIDLLQPADPFLDTAGEDLRRRIFITADQTGANLCLRPEFTIPVCLHHLDSGSHAARYGYAGTVFRQRQDEPHEFRQAGIEDLGNDNRIAADIAAITDCLDAMAETGLSGLTLVLGDQSVFEAMLKGLNLPLAWQKRLGRAFGDTSRLKADVARLAGEGASETSNLPTELEAAVLSGNANEIGQWVADRMRVSGISVSAGRSPDEIARRVLQKAELSAARLDDAHRAALETFLAIDCPIAEAPARLRELAGRHGLELDASITALASRVEGLAPIAGKVGAIRYRASFGRRLDYYTGLVFEVLAPEAAKPLAGGGRYDRLLSLLGSTREVPAVGFSIWLDRVANMLARAQ